MASKVNKFNRRQALTMGAGGLLGAQAGLDIGGFAASFLPKSGIFSKLHNIITRGDAQALAAANTDLAPPLITIAVCDKEVESTIFAVELKDPTNQVQADTFTSVQDDYQLTNFTPALKSELFPGLSNELLAYANAVNWRGIKMTKLWGSILTGGAGVAGLPVGYNLAFMTAGQKDGNHTLQDANMGTDKGSATYVFEQEAKKIGLNTGILGPVIFNMRSAATGNSASGFITAGGSPMPSFGSVVDIRSTLRNSLGALNADKEFLNFRVSLDRLVSEGDQSLDNLKDIQKKADIALQSLSTAMAAPDFIDQQLQTVFALYDAGLCANFGLASPCSDMNGGGSLQDEGGQYRLCAVENMAYLAYMIVRIANWNPQARIQIITDGTRSFNGGDQGGKVQIHGGPSNVIANGVMGPIPGADTVTDLGSNRDAGYKSNTGATMNRTRHMNDQAFTLATYGIDVGIPYAVEYQGTKILKK